MKKLLLIISLFVFFSFSARATLATSGACTGHGGVNCAAGAQSNGDVICNDGWTGSSVSYDSMSECNQNSYCAPPVASGYTTQAQCDGVEMRDTENGLSRYAPDVASGDLQNCESQVVQYQAEVQAYQNCLSAASPSYAPVPVPTARNPNSPYVPTDGTCYQRFYLGGNQCIPLPANAHATTPTGWQCDSGYSNTGAECIVPPNSVVINGIDYCNQGYVKNVYGQCVQPSPNSNQSTSSATPLVATPTTINPVVAASSNGVAIFTVATNLKMGNSGANVKAY